MRAFKDLWSSLIWPVAIRIAALVAGVAIGSAFLCDQRANTSRVNVSPDAVPGGADQHANNKESEGRGFSKLRND